MRSLIQLLALGAGLALPAAAFAQCTKDTDCKGNRVCENGQCVSPPSEASNPPAEPQYAPPSEAPSPPPPPRYGPPPPPPRGYGRMAPPPPLRINVLSVDLGAVVVGAANRSFVSQALVQVPIQLERLFSNYVSVVGVLAPFSLRDSGLVFLGADISAGGRFYFVGDAPRALWIGVRAGYSALNWSGTIGVVEAGYQFVLPTGLSAGFAVGYDFGDIFVTPFRASATVGWNF